MVKIILIKSPDEWANTKQACRDELVVYLSFSSHNIYIALLLCVEHCFAKAKIYIKNFEQIYIQGRWQDYMELLLLVTKKSCQHFTPLNS